LLVESSLLFAIEWSARLSERSVRPRRKLTVVMVLATLSAAAAWLTKRDSARGDCRRISYDPPEAAGGAGTIED
jgi:hypothetical protein